MNSFWSVDKDKNAQKLILEKGITDAELDPIDYAKNFKIYKRIPKAMIPISPTHPNAGIAL